MSRTEALRIQLDNVQLEMQQLEVENAKLREENTEEAALIEAVKEAGPAQGGEPAAKGSL